MDTSQELVEDYADIIRQAREKRGLSTEELGLKINEKESFLKKIEAGKTAPTELLISKLEHFLKIKLLVPAPDEKTAHTTAKAPSRELTLGDLYVTRGLRERTLHNESNLVQLRLTVKSQAYQNSNG